MEFNNKITTIKTFTFNLFQENTYIVSHQQTKHCIIIDPGCMSTAEETQLSHYIQENKLIPIRLINTHCHLDHIYGNQYIATTYQLPLGIHQADMPILEAASMASRMFGAPTPKPLSPSYFIAENTNIELDDITFKVLHTPGHSPGSICFYNEQESYCIVGDVLFNRSIGRTDLPFGDYDTLIQSITTKLYTLQKETVIYNGHGIPTSIAQECSYNPFVRL